MKSKKKKIDKKKRISAFMTFLFTITVVIAVALFLDNSTSQEEVRAKEIAVKISFKKLPNLKEGSYELWLKGDGEYQSLGQFNFMDGEIFDQDGNKIEEGKFKEKISFSPKEIQVSIESESDNSKPSETIILSGKIIENKVSLSCGVCQELQTAGNLEYLLATPTDGNKSNEFAGVWLIKKIDNKETPGFPINAAPTGFVFEEWISYQDKILSMGRFSQNQGQDSLLDYSSLNTKGPDFPGEDFLDSAPDELKFPARLNDGATQLFVTLEPGDLEFDPTGDEPFTIYLFSGLIEKSAKTNINYQIPLLLKNYMPSGKGEIL